MALDLELPSALSSDFDFQVFICLLGQFRLLKEKIPLILRAGGKAETLLGLLALRHNLGIGRETLLHSLWPEVSLAQASQSLNSLIYNLNRNVGVRNGIPLVSHTEGQYHLNSNVGLGLDIVSFEDLVTLGDRAFERQDAETAIEFYTSAAALYHGDLCISNEVYAILERERLRALYLTILARLAQYAFEHEHYKAGLAHAHRLVTCDPCREDAHRLMMRCYVRQGMRAQAIRQFMVCAKILHIEFDIAPEPETLELYDTIRSSPQRV